VSASDENEFQVQLTNRMDNTFVLPRLSQFGVSLGAAVLLASSAGAAGSSPSSEEMWRIIQSQQEQIETLRARINSFESQSVSTSEQVAEVDAKVEATAAFVEDLQADGGAAPDAWYRRTQIGGYGELHVNFGNNDVIDFHRWVAFISHDFSENIRFFSEVELEHSIAGDGKPGEIELEQAFVEFDLSPQTTAKAGLFLLPIGLLNETHEPATFFGVERNFVEREIIPTTWWEAGAALSHHDDSGFAYDVAVHSGLSVPTAGGNAFRIRSGRKKVAEAPASDGAVTGRVKYTGMPGLEVALAGQYQQDITQGMFSESVDALLLSGHVDWRRGHFGFRGLYARWDLGGLAPAVIGADEQYGFYLEPSYRFGTSAGPVGVFARFSRYDRTAGDNVESANKYYDFGVNFWPHERVVLKADLQITDLANPAQDDEIVNLGVGYQF